MNSAYFCLSCGNESERYDDMKRLTCCDHPDYRPVFSRLPDGTPLARSKRLGHWTGQAGYWVAHTADGRTFRHDRMWGSDEPQPEGWHEIVLAENKPGLWQASGALP